MPTDATTSPPPDPSAAVRLPAVLDLSAAQALQAQLCTAQADGTPVLDASAVERVCVPCLQILAAAQREAAGLRIVGASAALVAAVSDLGLSAAIPLEI